MKIKITIEKQEDGRYYASSRLCFPWKIFVEERPYWESGYFSSPEEAKEKILTMIKHNLDLKNSKKTFVVEL